MTACTTRCVRNRPHGRTRSDERGNAKRARINVTLLRNRTRTHARFLSILSVLPLPRSPYTVHRALPSSFLRPVASTGNPSRADSSIATVQPRIECLPIIRAKRDARSSGVYTNEIFSTFANCKFAATRAREKHSCCSSPLR